MNLFQVQGEMERDVVAAVEKHIGNLNLAIQAMPNAQRGEALQAVATVFASTMWRYIKIHAIVGASMEELGKLAELYLVIGARSTVAVDMTRPDGAARQ